MKIATLLVASAALFSFFGCGKKEAATTSSTNASAMSAAIVAASSSVKQANIASYPAASAFTNSYVFDEENALFAQTNLVSADWTTVNANVSNLYCGGSGVCGGGGQPSNNSSLKKWVDNMLDPNFLNSNSSSVGLMGRLQSAMVMPCVVGQVMGGSALPAVGTYTLSVTDADVSAANVVCKSNMTLQSSPMSVTATVTDVSGTNGGIFTRKMRIQASGLDQSIFVRDDSTVTRILTTESNSNQGYPYMNRYYLKYDKASKIGLFEGLERGYPGNTQQAGFYFYRIYVNETTRDIRVMGQNGGVNGDGSTTGVLAASTMFGGSGNLNQANATMAFLVKDSSAVVQLDKIGCINMSSSGGDVASAGACPSYAITDVTSGGAADTLVNTTVFSKTQAQWTVGETIADLSFTDATIFTANPAN